MAEGVVAVAQQYELVRELGRGMFGEVWLARKNPSGIEKAIKILLQAADRDSAQRELKSLELIKNLRHPYLLATEDFWIANNRLHVVMELADGTLRARLKSCLGAGSRASRWTSCSGTSRNRPRGWTSCTSRRSPTAT